jgi:hypothetical protein
MLRILVFIASAAFLSAFTSNAVAQESAPEPESDAAQLEDATPEDSAAPEESLPEPPASGEETVPEPPPLAMAAPQPSVSEVDVARLDAWLGSFDGTARVLRYIAAPLGILAGSALVGMGIWFVSDDSLTIGTREATLGLSAAIIALGAMSVGIGIYNFAAETPAEDVYARFTRAREEGLDARELGRFEGELRAMAEVSRITRYVSIVAGFSLALGGGLAMGISALEDSDEPRTIGLITGGVLALTGAITGALSFIPSPYERAWEKYELGQTPDGSAPAAQLTPLVGPTMAGVGVSGTF